MLFSAVSVLVVAQSSSEIPEGLMNNPVCVIPCIKEIMIMMMMMMIIIIIIIIIIIPS